MITCIIPVWRVRLGRLCSGDRTLYTQYSWGSCYRTSWHSWGCCHTLSICHSPWGSIHEVAYITTQVVYIKLYTWGYIQCSIHKVLSLKLPYSVLPIDFSGFILLNLKLQHLNTWQVCLAFSLGLKLFTDNHTMKQYVASISVFVISCPIGIGLGMAVIQHLSSDVLIVCVFILKALATGSFM